MAEAKQPYYGYALSAATMTLAVLRAVRGCIEVRGYRH